MPNTPDRVAPVDQAGQAMRRPPVRIPRPVGPLAVLTFTLVSTFAGLTVPPALAQKKAPQGLKVLLLSGGQRQHHGYREQALYLASALEDTGRYEVTIDEDAAVLLTPAMSRYDMIIVTADRRDDEHKFSAAEQQALLDWVKAGHGYVSIHAADNAAKDWLPEWREMLGGIFSHVGLPDGKVQKGTYRIKIADAAHPITRGLSDFDLKDELYYYMQMQQGVEALATTEHRGGTWPVAWTRTYGKGRVFHTPLGHRDFGPDKQDPLRDPNLTRLVSQGVDWVAEGSRADGTAASKRP
jgi:type 1 glutamine amidotransferase